MFAQGSPLATSAVEVFSLSGEINTRLFDVGAPATTRDGNESYGVLISAPAGTVVDINSCKVFGVTGGVFVSSSGHYGGELLKPRVPVHRRRRRRPRNREVGW